MVVKFADTQKDKEQKKVQQLQTNLWSMSDYLRATGGAAAGGQTPSALSVTTGAAPAPRFIPVRHSHNFSFSCCQRVLPTVLLTQGLGHVQPIGALPTAASPVALAAAAATMAATTPTVTVADSQLNVPSGQTAALQQQQPAATVSTLQGQTLTAVGGHPSLASAAGLTAAAPPSQQHINMLTLQQLLAASAPPAQLGSMSNGSGKVHANKFKHVNKL